MTTTASEKWARLSAHAQQKLLEEHKNDNTDHEWWDCEYEDFVEQCDKKGVCVDPKKIYFSGFWSQGDGASFSGYVSNWPTVLQAVIKDEKLRAKAVELAEELGWNFSCTQSGYYASNLRCSADLSVRECPYDEEEDPLRATAWGIDELSVSDADDIEESVTDFFNELAGDLYRSLEFTYDCLTNNEAVIENICDNYENEIDEALCEEEESETLEM